jgi:hypothetical protein
MKNGKKVCEILRKCELARGKDDKNTRFFDSENKEINKIE